MKTLQILLILLVASSAFAEGASSERRIRQPYERYQSIVDRQMFGPLPPGFDPTKSPSEVSKTVQKELTQEQEKLQSSIRFSMINLTPDGKTAVGFTDNSDPKTPVSYYLKVGESRNGWTVLEADAATATMRIAKGDIEVSLTIGGNSASDGAATSKTAAPAPATAASGTPGLGRLGGFRGGGLLLGSNSLRGRRAMRDAELKKAAEAEAKRKEAEKAEREEEKAQREEQRIVLEGLREELKKQREEAKAREDAKAEKDSAQESSNENNTAE